MDQMLKSDLTITTLSGEAFASHLPTFAELLTACVRAGASVNFVMPFEPCEAETYWREKILPGVCSGKRVLLAAWLGDQLAGTVNLDIDMPPNQIHRAEVSKLLVHPQFRRRGIARALMQALEAEANGAGRILVTLDTQTGGAAEPLYGSLGYVTVGMIPEFCRDACEDRLGSTTIMYKRL